MAHAVNGRSLYESKKQEFTAYKDILLYQSVEKVDSREFGCHCWLVQQCFPGCFSSHCWTSQQWHPFSTDCYAPLNTPLPGTPAAPVVGALPAGALAACVARARQRAERIKAHPAYTVAIGEDCRIVAPVGPPPSTQPTLKAVAETDFQVRLTFAMLRHDQIELQSKRGAEADFSLLAYDTNSPYLDARVPLVTGQPEVRQYRARWRDDDLPFGDWSDIVQVTARP